MVDVDANITEAVLCSYGGNASFDFGCDILESNSSMAHGTVLETIAMASKLLFLCIIIMTTVVGNLLVLFAVFVNSHLRSTTNYFIVNLAVADLLLGTTVLPFSASLEILQRWDFGPVFCDIWAAVDVLCCTASIISLCAISVDRYIGVTRPLAYSTIMTETRAVLLILVVWIVSTVISVGPLLGWKEPTSPNRQICTVTKQIGYVLFSVSGSFYIPTVIILLVYYRIYREAIKQTKFLESGIKTTKARHRGSQEVTLRVHTGGAMRSPSADNLPNLAASPERGRHQVTGLQGKLAKFKRQKKAAKTLGIVVGVFILCWFPFFFILPLSALCSSCYIPEILFQVIFWLGYCNSCLNPIIYASSSREFKRAFARILKCQVRRKPRVLSKESTLGKTCVITLRSKTSPHDHQFFQPALTPDMTAALKMVCDSSNGNKMPIHCVTSPNKLALINNGINGVHLVNGKCHSMDDNVA